MQIPQKKCSQSREKACGNNYALPNDSCCKDLRRRRTKRREQHHQGRFANPNAALRDGHHSGKFGKGPREEPYAQRETESTSDAQQGGEQDVRALHGGSQQPAKNEPPGTARNRADRVPKLRQSAPEMNGASAQERPAQCDNKTKKNCGSEDSGREHALSRSLQRNGQGTR